MQPWIDGMDKSKYEQGDRGLGKGELHCLGQSNKRSSFASHSIYKIQTQKDVAHAYNTCPYRSKQRWCKVHVPLFIFPLGRTSKGSDVHDLHLGLYCLMHSYAIFLIDNIRKDMYWNNLWL